MGQLPLFQEKITGTAVAKELGYKQQDGDEVEDMFRLLRRVKEQVPNLEAVGCGAILSHYQRLRLENVCGRLGLKALCFLWQRDQSEALADMVSSQISAVLVKVAGMGLCHRQLNQTIAELSPLLRKLGDEYGCNVAGEVRFVPPPRPFEWLVNAGAASCDLPPCSAFLGVLGSPSLPLCRVSICVSQCVSQCVQCEH